MRWTMALRAVSLLIGIFGGASAHAGSDCRSTALAVLERSAPQAFAVYNRLADRSELTRWITCEDIVLGLTTAVHEGVHALTFQLDAYPLVDGGFAARLPRGRTFFPPRRLAGLFEAADPFVETYLGQGGATSADDLAYLLDELNAYTHDVDVAVRLRRLAASGQEVHHADGLAALMGFVAAYVERASVEGAATWSALAAAPARQTVTTLWRQAEQVMASSCSVPGYGNRASLYLAPVCQATIAHGLGRLLGRPPLCPVSCRRSEAQRDAAVRRASSAVR